MLAQRLGNSINSTDSWNPTDGADLEGFWEFKRIGPSDVEAVSAWNDTSVNARNMLQASEDNQPSYTAATGAVVFNGSDKYLSTASEFDLADEFIIGMRVSFTEIANDVLIASNSTNNNFIRIVDTDTINFKFSSGLGTIDFTDGTDLGLGQKYSILIARNGSNVVSVYIDGVLQDNTATQAGTFKIDSLGVRATDTNDFVGSVYECVVYSKYEASTITELNTRLNSL